MQIVYYTDNELLEFYSFFMWHLAFLNAKF